MEPTVEGARTKQERFELMKESRPRLVVEPFSGGDGLLLDRRISDWFVDGDYVDARYLSVDPVPTDFLIVNSKEWGMGIKGRVEDVLEDKKMIEGVQKVWVKNPGPLNEKKEIWGEILEVLPRGGKLVIYDDYTVGLNRELGDPQEIFGSGVQIDNFTDSIKDADHPLLKRLYERQGKDSAVALVITK